MGRYVVVALAALVILMAVGAVIKMAVEKGLLTPDVRIASGFLAALAFASAGLFFRRRGDLRYGGALLALSLAVTDLVAWEAGPRFHLVSTPAALAAIDAVAVLLAALALHDDSEFLFVVAVGGALSAPFVASEGGGRATELPLYGFAILAGTLRAARNPGWWRALGLLVAGAVVYELAGAALPAGSGWYAPWSLSLFPGACAVSALLLGEREWRSELSRAYLGVALLGVLVGWDALRAAAFPATSVVALGLALVTYVSLAVRDAPGRLWTLSAVALPFMSVGIAYAVSANKETTAAAFAIWACMAAAAMFRESALGNRARAAAHLLAAAIIGGLAVAGAWWGLPLLLVTGLAAWGVCVALMSRHLPTALPTVAVAVVLGAAALSALDQLLSRGAYSYVPFTTRSSGSAYAAAMGIGVAGVVLESGRGAVREIATRPVRIATIVGFLITWGRMELVYAFNRDVASFLLSSYYAACGLATIVAGQVVGIGRLRVAGLGLALYAAAKAVLEVTDISFVALRVGAYGAVGLFLPGAGYLYGDRGLGEGAGGHGRAPGEVGCIRHLDSCCKGDKFLWLRGFCPVTHRLTAADTMGFRRDGGRGSHPADLLRSRQGTQDNQTSRLGSSARLGSPLVYEIRAHPGDSGWIPARIFGCHGPPAFVFLELQLSRRRMADAISHAEE